MSLRRDQRVPWSGCTPGSLRSSAVAWVPKSSWQEWSVTKRLSYGSARERSATASARPPHLAPPPPPDPCLLTWDQYVRAQWHMLSSREDSRLDINIHSAIFSVLKENCKVRRYRAQHFTEWCLQVSGYVGKGARDSVSRIRTDKGDAICQWKMKMNVFRRLIMKVALSFLGRNVIRFVFSSNQCLMVFNHGKWMSREYLPCVVSQRCLFTWGLFIKSMYAQGNTNIRMLR